MASSVSPYSSQSQSQYRSPAQAQFPSSSDLAPKPTSSPSETGHTSNPDYEALRVPLRGSAVLNDPRYNKGTAFTQAERDEFGLRGLLPFAVNTLDVQLERAYGQYQDHETGLRKNAFLQSLKSQNWVLFYSLLRHHLSEMFPIIYTPTEADAIASYSHLFRRSAGLFLSPPHAREGGMEKDFLIACGGRKLDLIVVSDGEQILGIGDQGSGGIWISEAKAAIYTLVAGVDPSKALSVVLDVGTNNSDLREDPLYVGWDHDRIRGKEYSEFVDQFVQLVIKYQKQCLLHFEDFGVSNAQTLLERYKNQHTIFNDDIQGTGAVTLASLQAAVGITSSKLSDQKIVIFGAGTAGLGIARQIRDAMVLQDETNAQNAAGKFWMVDRYGLIKDELGDKIREGFDRDFVRKQADGEEWGEKENYLLEVVKKVKPTVLIGTSTCPGAFTEEIVKEMSKHVDRPIIFPLSNPTRLCECQPKDALKWSNGKALMATGSPFDPVDLPNGKKYIVAECNNALVYPGLGLGSILSQAERLTDKMIIAGTAALANLSPALQNQEDSLLPNFGDSPAVNFEIALAVLDQAIEEGVAHVDIPKQKRREWAKSKMWESEYPQYIYDPDV